MPTPNVRPLTVLESVLATPMRAEGTSANERVLTAVNCSERVMPPTKRVAATTA